MLAPLMKYQVIATLGWIVLFGLIGAGLAAAGAPPWALVLVVLAIVAAQRIYCQILVPRGARARLLKAVDPTAGPPPGATPADPALVGRLDALSEAKDWDGLRSLLSDDFKIVVGKRRFGPSIYIRLLKATERQLPGERKTDEVIVHPNEPDVIWVLSTASGKPRFGPAFVSTGWTRVKLTSDGSRVREIASAGVLRVDGATDADH
jgi:hypothetical protein